jgi:hypothetical protein
LVEWNIPFTLTSPYGTLAMSSGTGYVFDPARCSAGAAIRETRDDIPQASGGILHREYVSSYEMHIGLVFMDAPDSPACAASLREMWEALQLHLGGLLCEQQFEEDDVVNRRIQWTPEGYGQDRLMVNVRLLEELKVVGVQDAQTTASFALHSPYPYVIDQTLTTTTITDGSTVTITNPGNTPIYSDFKVYGATSAFTYSNVTYGFDMIYDSSLPGAIPILGGDFAFFGHFANNVFLNGNLDNLIAGVDIENSDFFPLMPGANDITINGADMDVLWNAGWR